MDLFHTAMQKTTHVSKLWFQPKRMENTEHKRPLATYQYRTLKNMEKIAQQCRQKYIGARCNYRTAVKEHTCSARCSVLQYRRLKAMNSGNQGNQSLVPAKSWSIAHRGRPLCASAKGLCRFGETQTLATLRSGRTRAACSSRQQICVHKLPA